MLKCHSCSGSGSGTPGDPLCPHTAPRFLNSCWSQLKKRNMFDTDLYLSIYLSIYLYVDYIDILDIEIDINIVDAHKNTPYT